MKKLLGVVVILAALILGSYYGMGVMTERTIRQDSAMINQSNNGLYINLANYHRGWFKSEALIDWKLHVPERAVKNANGETETIPAQDFQWQMPVTVHHGPIIFHHGVRFGLGYARSVIHLPPDAQAKFKETFTADSTEPELDLSWFINYLNKTRFKVAVPAFNVAVQQQDGVLRFNWLGMNSATTISSDLDKINGDFTVDGVKVTKGDTIATVSTIRNEYNLRKSIYNFYTGDLSFSLPSVVVDVKGQKIFALDDFTFYTSTDVDNDLFNSHLKASVSKINAHNLSYGPGNLEIAFRNLDAQVLSRINTQIQKSQQGTDQEKQQALLAALPDLPKLFTRGAEFEVSEMSFTMPQGTIEGNMLINLPKGEISNPFELMQKMQGNGKLKVPADVLKKILNESNKQKVLSQAVQQQIVQQMQQAQDANATNTTTTAPDVGQQAVSMTDQQIAGFLQSGLLVQQGSDYVIEVKLNNGQFAVNDKPFNPGMLKF